MYPVPHAVTVVISHSNASKYQTPPLYAPPPVDRPTASGGRAMCGVCLAGVRLRETGGAVVCLLLWEVGLSGILLHPTTSEPRAAALLITHFFLHCIICTAK